MRENIEVHKKFYCELCDKFIFHGKYSSLNEHNKKVHGPKTKVECNYCGKYVANKHVLKKHIDAPSEIYQHFSQMLDLWLISHVRSMLVL